MKILVFDLDDTLYDEMTFVESGFRAVASYLGNKYTVDHNEVFDIMWKKLSENGRGKVFNDTLDRFGIYSKTNVKKCISVYRTHVPTLSLNIDAQQSLIKYKDTSKYIVTDGNKIVQHNKLKALNLYQEMNHCYITHQFGIKHSKPSPYCLLKIALKEKIANENIIYIGDNPNKDFVGIKPLGFKTIRIMQGSYKSVERELEFEAHERIYSLEELTPELIINL